MKTSKFKQIYSKPYSILFCALFLFSLFPFFTQAQVFELNNMPNVSKTFRFNIGTEITTLEIIGTRDVVLYKTSGGGNLLDEEKSTLVHLNGKSYQILPDEEGIELQAVKAKNIGLFPHQVVKFTNFKAANPETLPFAIAAAGIEDLSVIVHAKGDLKEVFLAYSFQNKGKQQTNVLSFAQMGLTSRLGQ